MLITGAYRQSHLIMGAPFSYTKFYGLICVCKFIPICAIDAAFGKSEFTKDHVKIASRAATLWFTISRCAPSHC